MMDCLFGNHFLENVFFRGMSPFCKIQMLSKCSKVHINKGEYVYYSDQIANNSSHG